MQLQTEKKADGVREGAALVLKELVNPVTHELDLLKVWQEGTQVSVVRRIMGDKETRKAIADLIIEMNSAFNISYPLNNAQVVTLSGEIMKTYWWLRWEELVFFFAEMKRQRWGQVVYRIDPALIFEFMKVYERWRLNECDTIQLSDHQMTKKTGERFGAVALREQFRK